MLAYQKKQGEGRTWENKGIKISKGVGGKRVRGEKTMATTDEEKERLGQKLLNLDTKLDPNKQCEGT